MQKKKKKTCPQIFTAAGFTVTKRQKERAGLRRSGRCPGRQHTQGGLRDEKGDDSIFPLGVSRSVAGTASHSVPSSPNVTPFPSHCPPHPPFQLHSEAQPSASRCQTLFSPNAHSRMCTSVTVPRRLPQQAGVLAHPSRCLASLPAFSKCRREEEEGRRKGQCIEIQRL